GCFIPRHGDSHPRDRRLPALPGSRVAQRPAAEAGSGARAPSPPLGRSLVVETKGSNRSVTSGGRRFILLQVQSGEAAVARRSVDAGVVGVTLLASAPVVAGDVAPQAPETVTVVLKDGSRLVGTIAAEDATAITVHTASGVELRLARDTIESVERGR